MDKLVYPREKTLGTLTLVLGIIVWILLIVGTLGVALIYVLFGFIGYLFAQSALIAWLRGTGVKLSEDQLPQLYSQYLGCCEKLGIKEPPRFCSQLPMRAVMVLGGEASVLDSATSTSPLGRT